MNKYLKDIAIGATSGAALGSACGSAAGVVGLHQMCHGNPSDICANQLKPLIISMAGDAAAQAGAGVGALVGAAIGGIVYPVYKGFMGWCYPRVGSVNVSEQVVEITEVKSQGLAV